CTEPLFQNIELILSKLATTITCFPLHDMLVMLSFERIRVGPKTVDMLFKDIWSVGDCER
ncbi:hypothetical protein SARC_17452, partial [Sphaeroforma arctica JP610]